MDEAICEVCGKKTSKLYSVIIEGSEMQVCKECASLGKKKIINIKTTAKVSRKIDEEPEETLVENYAVLIKQAIRSNYESLHNFCKTNNLKESWLKKVIDEEIPLTLSEARKLEKLLRIKLITKETQYAEEIEEKEEKPPPLTLGDILKEKLNLR